LGGFSLKPSRWKSFSALDMVSESTIAFCETTSTRKRAKLWGLRASSPKVKLEVRLEDLPWTDDLYQLGILNSKLLWFAISNISIPFGIRAGQYMEKVPIRVIDAKNPSDKSRHDRMVSLVEKMVPMHKQLAGSRTPHEKTSLQTHRRDRPANRPVGV
jgi:hypothetical protein